jgi:hypothetical protein
MKAVKLVIEVTAGIRPGLPSRSSRGAGPSRAASGSALRLRTTNCSRQAHEHAMHAALLLGARAAEADEYARLLRKPAALQLGADRVGVVCRPCGDDVGPTMT